jgi:hypothetical protein
MTRSINDPIQSNADDNKEHNKFTLNKHEFDLFHEEDNIVHRLIRVKRFATSKDEKWKIFDDNKVIMIIEGQKLTAKEKEFLRTVNGSKWLLSKAKEGIKSLNLLKNEIKKQIKNNDPDIDN